MAKSMAGGRFGDPGPVDRPLHRFLNDRFMQMVQPPAARFPVIIGSGRRKYPLPAPIPSGIRVFPLQSPGKLDPPGSGLDILPVLTMGGFLVPGQGGSDHLRQKGDPVPIPLSGPDQDLVLVEIHILDPKPTAFQKTEAGTVHQCCHDLRDSRQLLDQCLCFLT